MSGAKYFELSLKVMVNKEQNKVLFAEADSNFVDILLSFLTLPLGTVVKLLKKNYADEAPAIGSLTTLYNGLSKLDVAHFWTEGGKPMLLNPISSFGDEFCKLKLDVIYTQPATCFRCSDSDCMKKRSPVMSMYYDTMKCDCGKYLSKPMGQIESQSTRAHIDGDGVFVGKGVMFLITDDLKMAPVFHGTVIQTLINLGVTITEGAELRTVTLDLNDIVDLIRGTLLSNTPLTDLILYKGLDRRRATKDFTGYLPVKTVNEDSSSNSKKMTVKVWVSRTMRKVMLVQAEEDFVDFLFGLLTIPLGGVEHLLSSNTPLRNIDNLYRSVENFIDDKCFRTSDTKNRLMKPELPPYYLSKNQIFSLSEQMIPTIYVLERVTISPNETVEKGFWMHLKDPKGEGSYVRRGTFMLTDDLRVMHMDSDKTVRRLLKMGGSEVEELELHIGLEEGLNILKASLTSTSTLSDGLSDQISEKLRVQKQ